MFPYRWYRSRSWTLPLKAQKTQLIRYGIGVDNSPLIAMFPQLNSTQYNIIDGDAIIDDAHTNEMMTTK